MNLGGGGSVFGVYVQLFGERTLDNMEVVYDSTSGESYLYFIHTDGETLTLGPDLLLHGGYGALYSLGSGAGTILLQGTLSADVAGRSLTVYTPATTESFTVDSSGVVEAINGGHLQLQGAGTFDLGGSVIVDGPGSSLIATEGTDISIGNTSTATVSFSNGATGTFSSTTATAVGSIAGESATVTIDASSSWDAGGTLVVARSYDFATNTVGAGSTGGSATITVDGTLTVVDLYVGQNGELNGSGTLNTTTVDNDGGIISVGNSPGQMSISGDLQFTSGTLEIEFGGVNPGEFDLLTVGGTTTIGSGVIEFSFYGGFAPESGYSIAFLQSTGGIEFAAGDVAHAVIGVERGFAFDLEFMEATGTFTASNGLVNGDSTLFFGSSAADRYTTGAGDDVLKGGAGNDFLAGGDGNDWFVFTAGSGDDTIQDFRVGSDRLVLENGISIEFIETIDRGNDGVLDTLVTFGSGGTLVLNEVSGIVDADVLILATLDNIASTDSELGLAGESDVWGAELIPVITTDVHGDSLHA